MQLAVLGPMEVVSGAQRLALGGPKQRLVLGILAAARRRTVTLDELVDGLWPEGPQAQPRKTVQVYITRLRRTFGDDADAIRSDAAGYRLDTSALPTDADLFESDLDAVTPELDDDAAVALLRTALGRWRGDAFVDLRDCPAIVPVAVRLDELRLNAMQDLFEREVRRNPRGVISELEHAVEANPLHEGFAAQLMTAQYRAGRQADALATYQALRRRLSEELGLDPGPAARDLEGRILRHELTVVAPAAAAAPERQRRRVTVLSLELSAVGGATLDPEEELTVVAPVRQLARSQILHHGGVVLAEAGDGLTACFGFPARERSVESAVRAGLAIRDLGAASATGSIGLRTRIGIDTGVVVIEAGSDTGGPAELVGIAGEPLRAATVLRELAAPGDVLIGSETAAAVAAAVELETMGQSVRAVGVLPTDGGDVAGLVGRESDAAELAALAVAAEHLVSMVVVTGPAGIGKSALVENVLAALGPERSVIRLRCDRRQSVTPLSPFRTELPELFDGDREPGERAVIAGLRERWTAQPVLVVDDIDVADPSTLDVLAALVVQLPSGLLLLTSRSPDPLRIGDSIVHAVPLRPIDRQAARRLAAGIAGGRRLPLDTLNEIAERSGGVPLYIGALTRAALDSTDRPGAPSVPVTLYDSLMADLDRLGPARVSVQRCAVLGTTFNTADLELLGRSEAVVPAHLDVAVANGVLLDEGQGNLRFAHDLTASAAYESLLKSERSALHARVAEHFPPDRARLAPEQLAFHLEAAGRPFEAAVAWRRASTKSNSASRHAEAQQHARRSIALLDTIDLASQPDGGDNLRRSLVNLAIALQATSHGSAELVHLIDRLHALGIDSVDPPRAVVVGLIDVSNRQACGDFDGAERVAQATLDLAATIDEGSTVFARQFLGATRVWQGRLAGGGAELEQAAEYWDRAEAPAGASARAFGALWSLLGLAAHFQDRAADAAALFDRARATIPDDDGYGRCLVGATRATVEQLAGDADAVRDEIEPLWSLAMDLSSDFWMRWAQMLLGWALAADPDPTAAANGLAMMAEVLDDTAATKQTVPYFAHLMASRLAEHGRHDEALSRVDDGLRVAEETGERLWVPLLHLVRSRAHARAGRRAEAAAALAESAAIAGALGQPWVTRLCHEFEEEVR
jgi:DNA-binding SARP family transcriptional activator/tetratricopeptide (TPR) repeat protein